MVIPAHLPESRLPDDVVPPRGTPPPPWSCLVRAVLWLQRAPSPLPSSSPFAGRVRALAVGALVEYRDSPVGPYREVFVGQQVRGALLPVLHVPFIAVDSPASVAAGREHWSLPKALASFDGDTATGDGWSVRATPRTYGVGFPLRAPVALDQGGGRAIGQLRGTARLARVDVAVQGLTIAPWLGSGLRHGLVVQGRLVLGPPP